MSDLIRKCGDLESYSMHFDDFADDNRIFRVSSQIDYYEHLEIMKESIHQWSSVHPLLNAKLVKIDTSFYFANNNNKQTNNLKFLNVNTLDQNDYNNLVELLVETETATKLNTNEKLWRLTFIRQESANGNEFTFDIIFTVHHSIIEGRNMCTLILKLLDTFEQSHYLKNNNKVLNQSNKCYSVLPSVEDLFIKRFNPNNQTTTDVVGLFKPSFINNELAKIDSVEQTHVKYEKYLDKNIITNTENNEQLLVKNLIEIAETNHMKYSFVIFNKDDTSRLVKKLKLEKVTMQSFLNVLLSMSCRQVYAQLGSESEKNKTIVNNYTVSLRPFAEDKSQFGETSLSENIGFLIGFLYYMDNESKNEDSIKTFWQMVRKENESIKLKIENKDQYKPICNFGEKEFNPFEYLVDTVITNLGIIDTS